MRRSPPHQSLTAPAAVDPAGRSALLLPPGVARPGGVALGLLSLLALAAACGPTAPAPQDAAATAIAAAPTFAAGAQAAAPTLIAGAPTLVAGAQNGANSAQTAIAGAQTAAAVVQTVVPGAQATVQAGATVAVAVLNNPQLLAQTAGVLLGGASVNLQTSPSSATGDAVQQATLDATDTSGTFGQLDPAAERQSATSVLLMVAQVYPKATITLTIKDPSGKQLLRGTKAPGADPALS